MAEGKCPSGQRQSFKGLSLGRTIKQLLWTQAGAKTQLAERSSAATGLELLFTVALVKR